MPMYVNVSGTWKEITGPAVSVSGTWKAITGGWVNVSGVWKQIHTNLYTMTRGSTIVSGDTLTGYNQTLSYGSIDPSTYKDASIMSLSTSSNTTVLTFAVSGNRAQSFFAGLECSLGAFASADATRTYNSLGDITTWEWTEASDFPGSGSETVTIT